MEIRTATRFVATLIAATLLSGPALAWGDYAHRLTARIANAELSPRARAEVQRILAAGGSRVGTPNCRLASIEDASVWPDCARSLGEAYAYSAPWHYQNISVCNTLDIAAACPDGNCVTAQIPIQLAIAADRRRPAGDRARALAFIVHFTGDMHMPLHIGDKGDRGGNNVRADYGAKAPERMNLHRIWDSELAERALTEPPAITRNSPTAAQRKIWSGGTIGEWARQSWEISKSVSYGRLRTYPDGCTVMPIDASMRAPIDRTYVAAAIPSVRLQVQRAGVRLAMLLNAGLGR
jgi:hypothetical protein